MVFTYVFECSIKETTRAALVPVLLIVCAVNKVFLRERHQVTCLAEVLAL